MVRQPNAVSSLLSLADQSTVGVLTPSGQVVIGCERYLEQEGLPEPPLRQLIAAARHVRASCLEIRAVA